jgi:uncharacterized protein YegP (UPF0339 family)
MNKRYQVFVSSTYADLKEERTKVIQTIMELDCIPAGMEIFPAIDEEQFEFIKKIIDDCDYYVLIIGGRYGSLSEEGISYTEMEYEYALKKDIKIIAFIHSNPNEISFEKSEKNDSLRQKLEDFKHKVSTKRLIRYWKNADELPGLVALSLSKTIKTYPAIGWVRANNILNDEEKTKELKELRKENEFLKSKVISTEPPLKGRKFVITKRTNGEFQFNLKAGNGQTILTSEGYSTKAACMNGIESVKINSQDDSRFNKKDSSNGKPYFNLKASNDQIIGSSEIYESNSARDNGIASVKTNAIIASTEDQTS